MKNIFSKDFKSELTIGKISAKILVTILVALGWYLLQAIIEYTPGIIKRVSENLYNMLIRSVANGPENYDFFIFGILSAFVFSAMYALSSYAISKNSERLNIIEKKDESTQVTIEEKKVKLDSTNFILKAAKPVFSFYFFCILLIVLGIETQNKMYKKFTRKVNIVSPYIDQKIVQKIISDHCLMQNEVDYLKIESILDSIIYSNKLMP